MKPRIFNTTLYTLLLLVGMHGAARAQETQSQKEKDLETKLNALEQKIDAMQAKMDSLKTTTKNLPSLKMGIPATAYGYSTSAAPAEPRKVAPRALTRSFSAQRNGNVSSNFSFGEGFDKAFSGADKMNFSKTDKKIEEKVKSGEIKELTKNYSKRYRIGKNDLLSINNNYGNVTVNTWNKNEFKVDVEIKADANEQDDAEKLLDGVSINDTKDGTNVSFKTDIKEDNNAWSIWSNNDRMTVHKTQINYTIYMPSKNALNIANRYGVTIIPDFDGKLTINNSYGSFIAKKLSNQDNEINFRYINAKIDDLNGSNLKIAYGSLDLGHTNNLKAELSYTPAKIASIKTAGNISLRYGEGIKVAQLDKNLKSLFITSMFAPVGITLNNNLSCDFDVTVQFNDFKFDDNKVTVTSKTPSEDQRYSATKNYKGYIGKSNTDRKITIVSKYYGVKFD